MDSFGHLGEEAVQVHRNGHSTGPVGGHWVCYPLQQEPERSYHLLLWGVLCLKIAFDG